MTLAEASQRIEELDDDVATLGRVILALIHILKDSEPDLVDRAISSLEALAPLSGDSGKDFLEQIVSQLEEMEP